MKDFIKMTLAAAAGGLVIAGAAWAWRKFAAKG